jgi:hypothetical protein
MFILAGILVSIVVLAFVGFMLTVFGDWIFNTRKDETGYETPNRSAPKR